MTTVTVTQNTLSTNTIGLRINDGANVKASQFTVNANGFNGNTTFAINNEHNSESLTAEDNWWGNANGPAHAGNTFNVGSQGDTVTDNVDYVPWYDTDMTGTSFAPVNNTDLSTTYSSIQAAVTAANAGNTVTAAAGTYTENVVINKALTVKSVAGAATTTIDTSGTTHADVRGAVQLTAGPVTLGGAGVGFTIIAPDATADLPDQYGVELFVDGATSGVTIEGNTIRGSTNTDSSSPQSGIHFWGTGPYTTLTIKDNTLTTTFVTDTTIAGGTSAGIVTGANVESLQGTFDGNTVTGFSIGMNLAKLDAATTTIFGNTITGCAYNGLAVSGTADIDVYSNVINGCGGNGLAISGIQTDIDVYQNTIYNNGNGVKVYSGPTASSVAIRYNSIYSNTNTTAVIGETYGPSSAYENVGLLNADDNSVDATYNWWGTAAGPLNTANPGVTASMGNAVSGTATFAPWLYFTTAANNGDTLANLVTNQVPAYANSVHLDTVGWNTFSVPIGLDGQYNTWAELYTLTNLDYSLAYRFDPATQTFTSLATTSTYAIAPGEGFYIKMASAGSIPYCYSTVPSIPSRNLSAGWNLIGGGMTPRTEIDSCTSIATVGSTAGYTQIISPASNAAGSWVWVTGGASAHDFVAGEGYWVFLPIARTLGLFDLTPAAWVALP